MAPQPNRTNLIHALDAIELRRKIAPAPDTSTSIWVKVDRITTVTFKNDRYARERIEHFLSKYLHANKTIKDVEIRINNQLVEL